jgi:small subunit ribosomal protein S4
MKKQRKKYEKPVNPWDKARIEKERGILKNYGLKNKKEIWRSEALLRKYRRMARELAAKKDKEKEKVLTGKLIKLGMLSASASLDDVLGLSLDNILDRRLQTLIFKKGLVNSIKQSRQFITHGHVTIDGKKVVYPSYLVLKNEEDKIQVKIPVQVKQPAGSA